MKKIFSAFMSLTVLVAVLSMASCSETPAESSSKATSSSAPTGTSSVVSVEVPSSPTVSEEDPGEEAAYGDALTELLSEAENLMDEHFSSYSEISVTIGFDWDESDRPELGREVAPNLFDGDTATKWCCSDADVAGNSAVVWSMNEAVTVTHYTFTTANDNAEYPGRNPTGWRLYATNNELTSDMAMTADMFSGDIVPEGWVLLDEVTKTELPEENFVECGFAIDEENQGAYVSFMLLIDTCDTSNNVFQMSEIDLYGSVEAAE